MIHISDSTGVRVEMGSVTAQFIQGTDGDEVHASVGGMENTVEVESVPVGEGQHNVPDTNGMDSMATNPFYRVLSDGLEGDEIQVDM